MENNPPDLQTVIEIIRKEHRRTQMVFGISIIILAVIITVIAPGIIRMETNDNGNATDSSMPATDLPSTDASSTASTSAAGA